MKRIFSFFVESIFWLQLFVAPVAIGGLLALFIYVQWPGLGWLSIFIFAVSVIMGVLYAERVRRKHGTSRYASRILSTPDIWPNDSIELEKNNEEGNAGEASIKKDRSLDRPL